MKQTGSKPMSIPAHISRVVLDTVLDLLFPLLLTAAGNEARARLAVIRMLGEYHPDTAEELGLAGEIIAFRLKGLGALRDSSRPGPLYASKLDLMKVANTLRRSESAAQRKLDALQRARRAAAKQAEAVPAMEPAMEPAVLPAPATPATTIDQPDVASSSPALSLPAEVP